MRCLPAVAWLADGPVLLDGDPQARVRPMGPVVDALRALGADIVRELRFRAAPAGQWASAPSP